MTTTPPSPRREWRRDGHYGDAPLNPTSDYDALIHWACRAASSDLLDALDTNQDRLFPNTDANIGLALAVSDYALRLLVGVQSSPYV